MVRHQKAQMDGQSGFVSVTRSSWKNNFHFSEMKVLPDIKDIDSGKRKSYVFSLEGSVFGILLLKLT